MLKCNEDSSSDSQEDDQVSIERSLVVESMIEVDHLICSICHHLVWQPLTCGSAHGCQNAFCSYCIKLWSQKCHQQGNSELLCPQCKRVFISSKIPPIMKSILDSLILKCPNNPNGCIDILTYNQIGKHVQTCKYKLKRCRGCHMQILIKCYEEHINNCEKYLIQCTYCSAFMPKIKYLKEHVLYDEGSNKNQRGYECFQKQINNLGGRVGQIETGIEEMEERCDRIQNITHSLMMGEPLTLDISFYTTFQQHFSFPNPTLIKPSFNQTKEKFDFLHFYIINPINLDSFASIKWSIKITRMMGNILLGFCSTMNISSLDYIVNKYGELKRKDIHECKYKIIRKNQFNFLQGDVINCRYLSLLNTIKIENQTKKQYLQLGPQEVKEFIQSGRIFVFISMDTLSDSIQFI